MNMIPQDYKNSRTSEQENKKKIPLRSLTRGKHNNTRTQKRNEKKKKTRQHENNPTRTQGNKIQKGNNMKTQVQKTPD